VSDTLSNAGSDGGSNPAANAGAYQRADAFADAVHCDADSGPNADPNDGEGGLHNRRLVGMGYLQRAVRDRKPDSITHDRRADVRRRGLPR